MNNSFHALQLLLFTCCSLILSAVLAVAEVLVDVSIAKLEIVVCGSVAHLSGVVGRMINDLFQIDS